MDSPVAVKVVDCRSFRDLKDLDAMRNEIAVMATLRHPHIIDLLSSAYVGDRIFIVVEFAPGGDLKEYIAAQEGGNLQEQEARRLFGQCVNALAFCQRKRICHRDLKPENILLDADQNVKIADFGLASIVTPGCHSLQYCGTPAFSAPELFGRDQYDANPADVWSLGIVLYECLTGTLPFRGSNQAALVKKIRSGKYSALPESLSTHVKDLVAKMLVVDPDSRATIDEIVAHDWYLPPTGACSKELCLLEPDQTRAEPKTDDLGCVSDSADCGPNPAPHLCASPSRRLQHLHSSVLVKLDDSDLEWGDNSHDEEVQGTCQSQAVQNNSSCPHYTPDRTQEVAAAGSTGSFAKDPVGKCMPRSETAKACPRKGKDSFLQELKPATRRPKAAHFADAAESSAVEASNNSRQQDSVRLPKLETGRQHSVSMGGGLVGGGARVAAASSSEGPGDASRPLHTQLPHARRTRAVSVSSPGGISLSQEKGHVQKGSSQGIPAVRRQ